MVGWGQLKDGLKPAWNIGFTIFKTIIFPGLFPAITFGSSKKASKQADFLFSVSVRKFLQVYL